jgi:2-polyprenyl-6-methoxyphenol hydroxylase-like FAD-dependent oxidoreductase
VELGTKLVDFEQSEGQVVARLKQAGGGEEQVQIQYLVGTDGGRSTVRKGLKLSFLGDKHDEPIIYGDLALEGLDDQVRSVAHGHCLEILHFKSTVLA